MTYTKEQLVNALVAEWEYLCHDDYNPKDLSSEEYRKDMENLTVEELIVETCTDKEYTLDDYMQTYG